MRALRSACLFAVVAFPCVVARAQVPEPAGEPGGVPEQQTTPAPVAPPPTSQRLPVGPIRLSSGVVAGLKTGGNPPRYPAEAKAKGVSGSVVLHAVIDKDGQVGKLTVVSGNPLLADAAVEAVQSWTYRPYLLNGVPSEVDTTITVNFNLAPRPAPTDSPASDRRIKMVKAMPGSSGQPATQAEPAQPVMLSSVPPVYPAIARAAHVEGNVVVRAVIAKDGHVREAMPVSGPDILRSAAADAVRQWVYEPPLRNGEPAEGLTEVTVRFYLNQDKPATNLSPAPTSPQ